MKNFLNVDEYIAGFPDEIQNKLKEIRKTIKEAAPDSEEIISYSMPAYKLNGMLVYFAAFKDHIGFFPTPSGKNAFRNELSKYKGGKGTIHFPYDIPLPIQLIRRIVKYRVKENISKKVKNR